MSATRRTPRVPRWLDLLVLALLLAVLPLLGDDVATKRAPFERRAEHSRAWVEGREWRLRVRDVTAATTVETQLMEPRSTSGRWLVVIVEVEATSRTVAAPTVGVRDRDGTTWWQTERTIDTDAVLHGDELAPGITMRGAYVIETARDARPVELRVAASPISRLDSELVIPMRVDDRRARVELEPVTWSG